MGKHYRIIIMPEASSDLISIFEFVESASPQNARELAKRLFDAIDSLEWFPHRNRVHRSAKRPSRIVHSMTVAPHIVYYRIHETDAIVEVLTVRHGARKQPHRFK